MPARQAPQRRAGAAAQQRLGSRRQTYGRRPSETPSSDPAQSAPAAPRGRRRRPGRDDLFPDVDLPCRFGFRHLAAGYYDSHSGISASLGPAPTHRSMDYADLALCFGDRGSRLFNALQVVPTTESCTWLVIDVCSREAPSRAGTCLW